MSFHNPTASRKNTFSGAVEAVWAFLTIGTAASNCRCGKSGDYPVLSQTDTMLLALAVSFRDYKPLKLSSAATGEYLAVSPQ